MRPELIGPIQYAAPESSYRGRIPQKVQMQSPGYRQLHWFFRARRLPSIKMPHILACGAEERGGANRVLRRHASNGLLYTPFILPGVGAY
jgi:hypothetical protein